MRQSIVSVQHPRQLGSQTTAAERLRVNQRTIRRWIAEGRLTAYRIGPRLIRVDLAEVDSLLRQIPAAGA